jgi:ATP-binding cassette subfamily C (CFTR/MRP) protein 1
MRSALIQQIARKSLRLSPRARLEYTNGRQITAISADAGYTEWCFPILVQAIVQPFGVVIAFILLILNLGPSALVVDISPHLSFCRRLSVFI